MKYLIYKITNNVNGKVYIGKHKTDKLDDGYFGSGKILRNAIQKYGIQNFTFHLEFQLQNEDEMNLLEKLVVNEEFVKRTDTYNLKVGGEGGSAIGRSVSEDTRRKLSAANKGKHRSEEAKKKISAAMKGEKHPMFGKHFHHTEEAKKKISAAAKRRETEKRRNKCLNV